MSHLAWNRPDFHSSPAISKSLDAALDVSNLGKDDIDIFDFYSFVLQLIIKFETALDISIHSCFPIVPKLACQHLSIPTVNPPKPITILGGLTSFGGAGNNYSMHALTEMTRQLRSKRTSNKPVNGLVLANGGVVTYQHVVCLSTSPRPDNSPYPTTNPLPQTLPVSPSIPIKAEAQGSAIIEVRALSPLPKHPRADTLCLPQTYTVEYARDNTPLRGFVVGRLVADDSRFIANHADELTLRELSGTTKEQVGKQGRVWTVEGGRNVFAFESGEGRARL